MVTAEEVRTDVWCCHDPHDFREVKDLRTFLLYAYAESTAHVRASQQEGERVVSAVNADGKEVSFSFSTRWLHLNQRIDALIKEAEEWEKIKKKGMVS